MIGLQVEFNPRYHGVVITGAPLNIKLSLYELEDQVNIGRKNTHNINESGSKSETSIEPISRRSRSMNSIAHDSPSSFASTSSCSSIGSDRKRSQSLTIISISAHSELLNNRSFEQNESIKSPLKYTKTLPDDCVDSDSFTLADALDDVFFDFHIKERKERPSFNPIKSMSISKIHSYHLIVGYIHICGILSINKQRLKLTSSQQQHIEKLSNIDNWYPPPHLKDSKKFGRKGGGSWFISTAKDEPDTYKPNHEPRPSYICPIFSMPPMVLDCDKPLPLSWDYNINAFPQLPNAHPIGHSFKISYKCIIGLQIRHINGSSKQLIIEIPFRVISYDKESFQLNQPTLLNKTIASLDNPDTISMKRYIPDHVPTFNEKFQIKYDTKDLCIVSLHGSPFCLGQLILGNIEAYSLPTMGGFLRQVRMSLVMQELVYGNVCYKKVFSIQEFFGPISHDDQGLENKLLFSLPIRLECPERFTSPSFETSICQVSWFIHIQFFLGEITKRGTKQFANTETKKVCCERYFWDGTTKIDLKDSESFFECKLPIQMRFGSSLSRYHLFQKDEVIANSSKRYYDESKSTLYWELVL